MNLHPYLTPELLTLIRTAEPKEIEDKFDYGSRQKDAEWLRLAFRIDFLRGKSLSLTNYHTRPIKLITLASGIGSDSIKRRVDLKSDDWRENFIQRFNEVLHDCEVRLAVSQAKQDANTQRERIVKARKDAVVALVEPMPSPCRWYCENRYERGITESLQIDTADFTPEHIKQVVDLIRTFNSFNHA